MFLTLNVFTKAHFLISQLLLLAVSASIAQRLPLNTWQSHTSFHNAQLVTGNNDDIFCASNNGLFHYNLSDQSIQIFDKTNALTDIGVTALTYFKENKMLAIGFHSGIINLMYPNRLVNIETLKDAKILSSKTIRDFEINNNTLYVATDFGIATIDIALGEARDAFHEIGTNGTQVSVRDILFKGDSIFAISSMGILTADTKNNLLDFNNWYVFPSSDTLDLLQLFSRENQIYALGLSKKIYQKSGDEWLFAFSTIDQIRKIDFYGSDFYGISDTRLHQIHSDSSEILLDNIFQNGVDLFKTKNTFFVADAKKGLWNLATRSLIIPNSPLSDDISKIRAIDKDLWLFYHERANIDSFDIFSESQWTQQHIVSFSRPTDATYFNAQILVSSMDNGIYNYTSQNNLSDIPIADLSITSMIGSQEYLWVTNYNNNNDIVIMDLEGNWNVYASGSLFTREAHLAFGQVVWLISDQLQNNILVAFDPFENFKRVFSRTDGLPNGEVLDIDIDLENEVWIATSNGLAFYSNAIFPFEENKIIRPFFGNSPLFEEDNVTSICHDGGNRKWIATLDGLWAFDENFNELIYQFNVRNSPLPSNNILDLTFQAKTGELFILTDRGLISFQTDSSEPLIKNDTSIDIFPNPVSISQNNLLGIKGIIGGANIKITTIDGSIIDDFFANGSTASWDLLTIKGKKPSPGVYLIFVSDIEGVNTFVGKFAIIK